MEEEGFGYKKIMQPLEDVREKEVVEDHCKYIVEQLKSRLPSYESLLEEEREFLENLLEQFVTERQAYQELQQSFSMLKEINEKQIEALALKMNDVLNQVNDQSKQWGAIEKTFVSLSSADKQTIEKELIEARKTITQLQNDYAHLLKQVPSLSNAQSIDELQFKIQEQEEEILRLRQENELLNQQLKSKASGNEIENQKNNDNNGVEVSRLLQDMMKLNSQAQEDLAYQKSLGGYK